MAAAGTWFLAALVCEPQNIYCIDRQIYRCDILVVGVCHIAAALQRFSSLTGTGNGRLQYKGNAEQAADEIGTKELLTRAGREQCSG